MDHERHHNHRRDRGVRTMLHILLIVVIAGAALIGLGIYENYRNDPFRNCQQYDSAPGYWQWNCPDGRQFYTQK